MAAIDCLPKEPRVGEEDCHAWQKKLGSEELDNIHLARAFIFSPHILVAQRPMDDVDCGRDHDRSLKWFREFVDQRGIGYMTPFTDRGPRTAFFSAGNHQSDTDKNREYADIVWSMERSGIEVTLGGGLREASTAACISEDTESDSNTCHTWWILNGRGQAWPRLEQMDPDSRVMSTIPDGSAVLGIMLGDWLALGDGLGFIFNKPDDGPAICYRQPRQALLRAARRGVSIEQDLGTNGLEQSNAHGSSSLCRGDFAPPAPGATSRKASSKTPIILPKSQAHVQQQELEMPDFGLDLEPDGPTEEHHEPVDLSQVQLRDPLPSGRSPRTIAAVPFGDPLALPRSPKDQESWTCTTRNCEPMFSRRGS